MRHTVVSSQRVSVWGGRRRAGATPWTTWPPSPCSVWRSSTVFMWLSPSTRIFTGASLKGFLDFRLMGLGNNHWRRSCRMDAKAKIILKLKNWNRRVEIHTSKKPCTEQIMNWWYATFSEGTHRKRERLLGRWRRLEWWIPSLKNTTSERIWKYVNLNVEMWREVICSKHMQFCWCLNCK